LRGNPLISETNVVCSGGWSNGSDLLFRTMEWKRISVWSDCGTAFFFAGVSARDMSLRRLEHLWTVLNSRAPDEESR
jgi:hypothetical protein